MGYDQLAEHGAMILGERLRSPEERLVVIEVLERVMKAQINMELVFTRDGDAPFRRLSEALQQPGGGGEEAGAIQVNKSRA